MNHREGGITRERMGEIACHLLEKRMREIKERVLPLSFDEIQGVIEAIAKELDISYSEANEFVSTALFREFIDLFDKLDRDKRSRSF